MKKILFNRKTFVKAAQVIFLLLVIVMAGTRCIKIPTEEITITLSVSPISLNYTPSGEQKTFSITSNDRWTVNSDASWLTVSSSSGSNNETVSATVVANTNTDSRTATITVRSSVSGVAEQTITATQAALIPTSLTVSTDSLRFITAGEQKPFTITSNTNWSISNSESWLTVSPTVGSNDGTVAVTVTVTATANTSTSVRTATITVSGGGLTRTIYITQEALTPTPTLTVSPNSLSFVAAGEQKTFTITSNSSWAISIIESWLTASSTIGSGNRTVTVTATPNTSISQRTATITVSGAGLTRTINVTQSVTEAGAIDYEPEMIFVQGGTFIMGCTSEQGGDCEENERPSHQVTVGDFFIGRYEITQGQWKAVMGYNPSYYYRADDCPVEYVGWNDIQEFISRLNVLTGKQYRLPTEAEWEFAARGGGNSRGYRYSGSNTVDDVAWYRDNIPTQSPIDTRYGEQPVGTKAPNELGIYDMSGNVWEWCSDWYGGYSSNAQDNPKGADSGPGRVYRGGSWGNTENYMRVSIRFYETPGPNGRSPFIGFRLARNSNYQVR